MYARLPETQGRLEYTYARLPPVSGSLAYTYSGFQQFCKFYNSENSDSDKMEFTQSNFTTLNPDFCKFYHSINYDSDKMERDELTYSIIG